MPSKQKTITKKYAKGQFRTVGLALILYGLLVLILPIFVKMLMVKNNSPILENENIYIGLYYILILVGTILPFFLMAKAFKVRLSDVMGIANISFKNRILESIVFFTVASVSIFVTQGIANYLGIPMNLIFNIGTVASETHFDNLIYAFLFVFACPFVEELAFRGCLLSSLSRFGKKFAVIMSAVFFALAHGSFIEMIPALVIGYMLGKIAIKYNSVQPCIIVHIIFNLFIYGAYLLSDASFIISIALALIYMITLIICLRKKYRFVSFKTNSDSLSIYSTFLSTTPIILAILLFISHSLIIEIMKL